MSFFSPNLAIISTWQQSLRSAFMQLRGINFATDESFVFTDFDPKCDYYGMTTSNISINTARYLKLNKLLFISIDIAVTLAAPMALQFSIELPDNNTARGEATSSQVFAIYNNGVAGLASVMGGSSDLYFSVPGAGARQVIGNGFVEVI